MIPIPHLIAIGLTLLDIGGVMATGILLFYAFAFAVISVRDMVSARNAKLAVRRQDSEQETLHNMYGITISPQNLSRASLNTAASKRHQMDLVRPEHKGPRILP
jgi:hypothetical protein